MKIPAKWKPFYEHLLQGKNPFQNDSDGDSIGLYGLMEKPINDLRYWNSARGARFNYKRPHVPFVIRMQTATLDQAKFVLQYGFYSRARNLQVERLEDLEQTVSTNEDLFVDLAHRQKQGMSSTGKGFPALFVETSGSLGWFKRATNLIVQANIHWKRGVIITKIKADRGVPVDGVVFKNPRFSDDEGGVLFLGNVKSDEIVEALYIDDSGRIFRLFRNLGTGQWHFVQGSQNDIDTFADGLPQRYTPKPG